MLSWEEIVEKYIVRHSKRIQQVTRPLRDRFGIEYFTYHKINAEGHYTVLVDRPDWAEQYVAHQIYLEDPFLRHPSVFQSGVCFMAEHGSQEAQEKIMKLAEDVLEISNGVILVERQEDEVEFFGCASKDFNALCRLYFNQQGVLKAFFEYFKSELSSILLDLSQEPAFLSHLKGEQFFFKDPMGVKWDSQEFLKEIGQGNVVKQAGLLSQREVDCVRLLFAHKSAKEIAQALGLSPRTVESYLENVKSKLGCLTRKELLEKAQAFLSLNLI